MHIFNLSIKSKTFQEPWKTGTITPIHKEGSKSDPANYRPITILNTPSKLLERIIHNQLNDYLKSNNILDDEQSGFRNGHSTATCMISILNGIYENMEKGGGSGVIFLDLKKAFDTVDHNILLNKLKNIG